jgi:hypothetical protein
MKLRLARKIFKTGGWLWDSPKGAYRLGSFLEAKRIVDRQIRRKAARLRAAGLLR